jgi:site-specific recombinase XerD
MPEETTGRDAPVYLEPREWTESFLRHLEVSRGCSGKTLRNYEQTLREASGLLAGKDWRRLSPADFRNYLYQISVTRRLSPASARLRFSALRSF